jgi:hypothetical protein
MADLENESAGSGLLALAFVFGTGVGIITHNLGWGLVAGVLFLFAEGALLIYG